MCRNTVIANKKISDPIEAVAHVADQWTDPEHPSRADAAESCIEASEGLTEPALTFALNQFVDAISAEGLDAWLGGCERSARAVGILVDDPVPTETLRVAVAVWATGGRALVRADDPATPIVRAFAGAVRAHGGTAPTDWVEEETLYRDAEVFIAVPSTDTVDAVQARLETAAVPDEEVLVIPPTYSVAVLDGDESDDEYDDLAEDILLYEGGHRRSVKIVWAPQDLTPDPMLEAMAQFRGVVPAHASTPGRLEMPKALLDAQDAPHAYADGLQFLMSRNDPEPQPGAHVRWSEYATLDTVHQWIRDHESRLHAVVARAGLGDRGESPVPHLEPGRVHRPAVPDADDRTVVDFLSGRGGGS